MGVTRGFGGFPAGASALPAMPGVPARAGGQRPGAVTWPGHGRGRRDDYGRGRVRPLTPVSPCVRTRRGPSDVGLCLPSDTERAQHQHCGGAYACAGETGESSAKTGGGAGAREPLGRKRHGSPACEQQPCICSGLLHQGVD
ncbi:hypothetical protein COCMIDRAFT_33243 [Bipolaris oryzae ATCC 44560]|uniref:Uncharacterized protein n=1 Tax=Bipolaris oryzae ATCC 44560 TaxID=930090 RepID=W6ZHJ6_COCMI|nr:uncharacterized protein COCMIDRAFT_33243 [Bipolaris oryzae ATCC 44560]EUC49398.1 hypothetical protein COCMIDRAFT_33243 [Bipolaris oryzae ATCC 44560]